MALVRSWARHVPSQAWRLLQVGPYINFFTNYWYWYCQRGWNENGINLKLSSQVELFWRNGISTSETGAEVLPCSFSGAGGLGLIVIPSASSSSPSTVSSTVSSPPASVSSGKATDELRSSVGFIKFSPKPIFSVKASADIGFMPSFAIVAPCSLSSPTISWTQKWRTSTSETGVLNTQARKNNNKYHNKNKNVISLNQQRQNQRNRWFGKSFSRHPELIFFAGVRTVPWCSVLATAVFICQSFPRITYTLVQMGGIPVDSYRTNICYKHDYKKHNCIKILHCKNIHRHWTLIEIRILAFWQLKSKHFRLLKWKWKCTWQWVAKW